jgi:hypothetical protein
VFLLGAALFSVTAAAQISTVTPIAAPALQKLLPAVDGWKTDGAKADQIVLSPEAPYTFARVDLTKADVRVRLQLSDTGKSPDTLTALAMIVVSMPADFSEDVAGTAIKRLQLKGSPAAEVWDAGKASGEITVVIGGRFVVTVESSTCQGLDPLRGILEALDFKAIEALK